MLGHNNWNLKNLADSRKSKMRFAGLKVIRDDLKYFATNKKKLIAVIVIAFIPLLYSFLYLDAFWDPYSKLDKMPVAVVNLDNGAIKDGKNVNYGKDFVDKLKDNKKVNWVFTSYSDADNGIKGKKYYSMVVIPENFSETITDSVNGNIQKASISYIPNEKKNFLAAQVSSRIMLELKDEVAKNITAEGSKILVDSLYKTKDGFKTASEGSKELNEGAGRLNEGAGKLYDGAVQLDNKIGELKNGFVKLQDGSKTLLDGLQAFGNESGSGKAKLISGARDLSKGAGDMNSGLKEYNTKITEGENKLKSGLKEYDTKITEGENRLKDASGKLSDGLNQLKTGLDEYNTKVADGVGQLRDGAKKVSNGLGELNNGLSEYDSKVTNGESKLLSGAKELSSGMDALVNGLNQLNSNLSTIDSGEVTALIQGSDSLSSGIATTAGIISSLDTGIESNNLTGIINASKDIPDAYKESIINVLTTVQALNDSAAMPALKTGAESIAAGTKQLSSFGSLVTAVNELSSGANTAKLGADQLYEGLTSFQTQSSQGLSSIKSGVSSLKTGAGKLVNGIADFKTKSSEGYKTLYNGVESIKTGSDQLSAGIKEFQSQSSKGRQSLLTGMNEFADQSKSARKSLLSGSEKLSAGSGALFDGLKEYDSKTSEGVNKLIDGAAELNSGESEALNGVERIRNEGSSKLVSGLSSFRDGAQTLQQGTQTLQQGLKDGYNEINNKLKADSGQMSKFLSEPVSLVEKPVNHVPEYGSGFTPYFIPLSLWVGALLMFLFVPMEVNKRFKKSPRSVVFGKFVLLLTIGILQAVISSAVILTALHLQVQNLALFFGFNILLSAAFIAIIQSLIYLLGEDIGKFLALVLLMLQLTSCGGTFPMELVPKFFSVISPFLPMTYGTSGLREIISGIDYSVLGHDVLILTAFIVGFLTLSAILKSRVEKIKTKIISLRGTTEEIA